MGKCYDAEAHGENNCNRRQCVGDGCTQEVEVCIRVVSELPLFLDIAFSSL